MKDRNGQQIEKDSGVVFKVQTNILQGRVIGFTKDFKYVRILAQSIWFKRRKTIYNRTCNNIVVIKNLDKWNN